GSTTSRATYPTTGGNVRLLPLAQVSAPLASLGLQRVEVALVPVPDDVLQGPVHDGVTEQGVQGHGVRLMRDLVHQVELWLEPLDRVDQVLGRDADRLDVALAPCQGVPERT